MLSAALSALALVLIRSGDFAAAAALVAEREEMVEAAGSQFRLYSFGALELAAWQGDEAKTTALIEATFTTAVSRSAGLALGSIDCATAVLYNGLGRYEETPAAAQRANEHPQELLSTLFLPERSKRHSGADRRPARPRRSTGSRRSPAPAAPTGRWESRRAGARC